MFFFLILPSQNESRESMVMMGRRVFLEKLARVVKLAFQDSQEIRELLDQR